MKRLISTGLVIFILLTLSLSVYGVLPDNDQIGVMILKTINFRYYNAFIDDTENLFVDIYDAYPLGELQSILVRGIGDFDSTVESFYTTLNFDVRLNDGARIYFPVPLVTGFVPQYNFGDLEQYRNSSLDVYSTVPLDYITYNFVLDSSSGNDVSVNFTKEEASIDGAVRDIQFLCFEDVPAGIYELSISIYNEDDLFLLQQEFVVAPFVSVPSLFDDVANGNYTASYAYEKILQNLDAVINSNASYQDKQLALAVSQLDLQRIYDAETQLMSSLVLPALFDMVNSFIEYFGYASNVDELTNVYKEGYDALVNAYVGSLPSLINSGTGILFTDEYNAITSYYDKAYEVYKSQLESSIITDDDLADNDDKLQNLVDIYDQEKQAHDAYKDLDLGELVDINQWNLDVSDFVSYRQIFDQFFKGYSDRGSSVVAMCVSFPFTLLIVSLILGTSGVVFSFTRKD